MAKQSLARLALGLSITLFLVGNAHLVHAQTPPGMLSHSAGLRTSDPVVNRNERAPKANLRRPPSPADEKRQAIGQAITEGNAARASHKYQAAVAAYERVVNVLDPKDARAHFGLGNVYTDLACLDSAIASYRTALSLKKDYRDAIYALGNALANKQRYDEAESQFQELLKSKKTDPAGIMGLGFVSWKRKKYDEAIKQLNLVTNDPTVKRADRAAALVALGDINREREKWDEAKAAYNDAIKLATPNEFSRWVFIQSYLGLAQSELFPALSNFSRVTIDERSIQDRERTIRAAKQAENYVRRAVYDFKFDHPNSYLFWAFSLEYQFRFRDAESKFNEYLEKVNELENQLPSLAKTRTCDYGFVTLRANYYRFMGHLHQQERFLSSDPQKIAELDNKAIQNFLHVIRLKSDDPGAYSTLADIYFLQGKYAEAIEHYENALSRETDESKKANYYHGRGFAYSRTGRLSEAIDDLNRAMRLKPADPAPYWTLSSVYAQQGKWDEAVSIGQQGMEREKPPTAHSYQFWASTHFQAARRTGKDAYYEEAIKLANTAIQISPTYASAYLLLGNIYKFYPGGGNFEEAAKNYELAAKHDPRNPLIFYGLGDLYLLLKNENAAIKTFKDAIALKPDFANAYWALGHAYHRRGDDLEAIKQFENAIKQDGKHLNAFIDLADVYDKQKRHEEAIRWLRKAIEEFPTNYLPYKELARIYTHAKNSGEAIRYYERAIGLLKGDQVWFGEILKCRVLRLQAQYSESISCAQKVKMPASGDPAQIPYEIGLTHVASGNKEAALKQYEELKKKQSSLAEDLLRMINDMK